LCKEYVQEYENYPSQILKIPSEGKTIHPTQKPVALFEYLIRTYTDEGDIVLDNCAGSFTTAIASDNLNRKWICIEKEASYCEIGRGRIEENRKRLLTLLDNGCV
jgi:site-specific DNA-methyltransferase (adenine-specific)